MSKVTDMQKQKTKKVIKTWSRRSTILPEMVGLTFAGSQRPQIPSGFRHGKHGWTQAG